MGSISAPGIWITYAWADNSGGDFSYLVQELSTAGVKATYDKIAIIPGRRLWEQIAERITKDPINGWGYLLTPTSLASEACLEELAYALDHALNVKGGIFPLIGLLHGVRIEDVPLALKVRLCVSLASHTWREEVKAALEGRPPVTPHTNQPQYVSQVHSGYGGVPSRTAVEVRPRFGEIMFWRFAVPASASIVEWGHGPAGGGRISGAQSNVIEGGTGSLNGTSITWFGAGDRLSPGVSAYVVFSGSVPDFVGFGPVADPFGQPGQMEVITLR